jgi:hypothetical protein
MAVDHIRYDILTQEAMRGVVRSVLVDAAAHGLPGEHHFFISFDTHAEGVKMSPRLRAQYPEDMTIVLQHQFWDLTVTDEAFEVGLSFNGVPERLTVPLLAIVGFADPSVQFALQFGSDAGDVEKSETAKAERPARPSAQAKPADARPADKAEANPPRPAGPLAAAPAEEPELGQSGGAEVVRLDRFRKK